MKLAIFEPLQESQNSIEVDKYKILKNSYENDQSFDCSFFPISIPKSFSDNKNQLFEHYIFLPLKDWCFDWLKILLKSIPHHSSLIFHLDGYFIFHAQKWSDLIPLLKGRKVKFVVTSTSHQELVKSLVGDNNEVSLMPVVPSHSFVLNDSDKILSFREKLSISCDEFVFLYHGPLTRQSNLLELTRLIIKLRSQLHLKIHLWVYGQFDDLAMPLIGKTQLNFEFYQQWKMMVDSFEAGDYIRYLGEQEDVDECAVISSSDWGIFATAIDSEDFNFFAHKLMAQGLPLILSQWGPHFDYKHSDFIKKIPLLTDSPFHQVDFNSLAKLLISLVQTKDKRSVSQRNTFIHNNRSNERFDNESELRGSLLRNNNIFSGFSELFLKVEESFEQNPYAPFVDIASFGAYNSIFKTIYEPYIRNN